MSETLTAPAPKGLEKYCPDLQKAALFLSQFPALDKKEYPLTHRFTPGLYSRQILMKRGTSIITRIHRTEHQFIISQGRCLIWTEGKGWEEFSAPYHGITKVGTQRALSIIEDTIFTTFHATELTDVPEIERWLTEDVDDMPQPTLEEFLARLKP